MCYHISSVITKLGISVEDLAKKLDMNPESLLKKLNGDAEFTLDEAIAIKNKLQLNDCIEFLFSDVNG